VPPLSPCYQKAMDILSRVVAFESTDRRAFAQIPAADPAGTHCLPVRSTAFRNWFAAQHETPPNQYVHGLACRTLEAQASAGSATNIPVPRRAAFHPDRNKIFLDLADPEGRFVEISSSGWSVDARADVPFEFSPTAAALPAPETPSDDILENLRATLRLDRPNFLRALAWMLAVLRPSGPAPVLILRGPAHSGKSLAARILRGLVDSSITPLLHLPTRVSQLLILARHNYVLAFDHISRLSPQIAETLCRLATGIGVAWRQPGRHEPAQQTIRRPIILTVTDDFVPPPDLAARAIFVTLPAIDSPREEEALLDEIQARLPQLLGAICDRLSQILAGRQDEEMRQAVAAPPPLHPFVAAVDTLLAQNAGHWTGTAAGLLIQLRTAETPKGVVQQLNRHTLPLHDAGIAVTHQRRRGAKILVLQRCDTPAPPDGANLQACASCVPPRPSPETPRPGPPYPIDNVKISHPALDAAP
jgi:hypothetical protein